MRKIEAVVIGLSAGGMKAAALLFSLLKPDINLPIIVVQHLHPEQNDFFLKHLQQNTSLEIVTAKDKDLIKVNSIYFAPPDYHLILDDKYTLSLSYEEKINFSRPSIDVLFESAAEVFSSNLAGVLMTGANSDGAYGLYKIKNYGGIAIIQDPESAEYPAMPQSVLNLFRPDFVLDIPGIADFLNQLKEIR